MTISITKITHYVPITMSDAGGFEFAGTVEIEDDLFYFTADKFDTDSFSGGVDIKLYADDKRSRQVDWADRVSSDDNQLEDPDEKWEEIQEQMVELLDEIDNAIYGEMLAAKDRAIAHYRMSGADS